MIDKLKKEDYNILVINALNGSFAISLRKKFPKARIICAEVFPYFVSHLKKLGFEVIMYNEISADMKLSFDAVVGNPPFQDVNDDGERKDQASNLWTKFWAKTLNELSKKDGIAALITPTSWLSPSADFRSKNEYALGKNRLWDAFNKHDSYADVINVKQHFNGIGSTFGYVIVNKGSKSGGLKFSDGSNTSLGFLPRSNYDLVITKLHAIDNLSKHFTINQSNTPDIRVSIPISRALTETSIEILTGKTVPTQGHEEDRMYLYVHVKTLEQAEKVRDILISCIDILNTHCRWAGFINNKTVSLIKYEN